MSIIRKIETRSENQDDDPLSAATAAVTELRSSVEGFTTETRGEITKIGERVASLETRLNRPGTGEQTRDEQRELELRAFLNFARRGAEYLPEVERRALNVADDGAGGYTVPPGFVAELLRDIVEMSPIRQVARVGSTGANSVILPKRTGTPTVNWTGETEDVVETETTYGQVEIPIHQATAFIDVSNTLLEDSAINLEAELRADFAEELARAEGKAFVDGDGVKRPHGFLSHDDVAETNSGGASTITADGLIDIFYQIKAAYRPRSVWVMNSSTVAAVRKLKSATEEIYLWQLGLQAGQPDTLLGRPIVVAEDMPNVASGTFPIVLADWQRFYRIYDRVALNIVRDPYSKATNAMTRFHVRRRVGGGVVIAEAGRKLKIAS